MADMERFIQDYSERNDLGIRNEKPHNKTFQPTGINRFFYQSQVCGPSAEICR
jgi:hypothetical protein